MKSIEPKTKYCDNNQEDKTVDDDDDDDDETLIDIPELQVRRSLDSESKGEINPKPIKTKKSNVNLYRRSDSL